MAAMNDFLADLAWLSANAVPRSEVPRMMWGTVVNGSPGVTVRLENTDTARQVSGNAAGTLLPGQRVRVEVQGTRVTVLAAVPLTTLHRRFRLPSPVSVPSNTNVIIPASSWDPAPGDPGAASPIIHQSGGAFWVPVDGLYMVAAGARWENNTVGAREMHLHQNGVQCESVYVNPSSAPSADLHLSAVVWAQAGDTLAVVMRQSSPTTLNVLASPYFGWKQIAKVG